MRDQISHVADDGRIGCSPSGRDESDYSTHGLGSMDCGLLFGMINLASTCLEEIVFFMSKLTVNCLYDYRKSSDSRSVMTASMLSGARSESL